MLALSFDYRLLKVYAGMIYVSSLVLLVLVRTPLGTSVKGAQRWFELFGFQLAPSEIAKLALIAMLAAFLSELRGDLTLQDVFRTAGLAAIPAFLVFLQPDLGSSIVFVAILVGMLVVAGARARYLAVLALAAVVLIVAGFQVGLVREYQIERLKAFLDPESVSAGALVLLGLYGILLWRAFRVALLSRDPFGTYLAAGIASMFALQMFVNVGMNVGIMPITGIPLPFVSYGGSSLLLNLASVGLLLNVHMRRFV